MKKIILLPGDGIGPEIVKEAKKVLDAVSKKFGAKFEYVTHLIGGASIDKHGEPLTDETILACKNSDAILLGAVGGYKWDTIEPSLRPEKGLLKIRKELNLFANIRPTKLWNELKDSCPLKSSIVEKGIDFVIIRELTGGAYFGKRRNEIINGEKVATDEMTYSESEIRRIGKVAFETAMKRNKKLCSVDKANVLDSSKLWRAVMTDLSKEYKDVEYSEMYVDNAAMQIIKNPSYFDVVVTENMFGDILSDEASVLAGSLGMMPSASLSNTTLGMYEPIHGSAPDIAGKDIANPVGTILSAAMMLKYSLGMQKEADAIEKAVEKTLKQGFRTIDIATEKEKAVTCSQMGTSIANNI